MQQLPNNCRIGKILLFPKNWNTTKADVKVKWHIKHRFYDDNLKEDKRVTMPVYKGRPIRMAAS